MKSGCLARRAARVAAALGGAPRLLAGSLDLALAELRDDPPAVVVQRSQRGTASRVARESGRVCGGRLQRGPDRRSGAVDDPRRCHLARPGHRPFAAGRLARVSVRAQDRPRPFSWAHARVEWASGGWLRAGDAMTFTAAAAAEVAYRLARGEGQPGAYTLGHCSGRIWPWRPEASSSLRGAEPRFCGLVAAGERAIRRHDSSLGKRATWRAPS